MNAIEFLDSIDVKTLEGEATKLDEMVAMAIKMKRKTLKVGEIHIQEGLFLTFTQILWKARTTAAPLDGGSSITHFYPNNLPAWVVRKAEGELTTYWKVRTTFKYVPVPKE